MNKEVIVDKTEIIISDDGAVQPIAYKGRVVNVVEINDLDSTFLDHQFSSNTVKNIFWSQFEIDYCGG